jgi:hypothetical protein
VWAVTLGGILKTLCSVVAEDSSGNRVVAAGQGKMLAFVGKIDAAGNMLAVANELTEEKCGRPIRLSGVDFVACGLGGIAFLAS